MKKKDNILITAVGGDIGQSVVHCLLETEYAKRLCGCDMDPYAAGRALLRRFEIAPTVDDEKSYKEFVLNVIKTHDVRFILPITEKEISFFSRKISYFESLGIKVLVLHPDLTRIFLDKYATIEYLKKNKFDVPRTFLAKNYKGQLEFPFILKSRHVCGGKGLVTINGEQDLMFYLDKNPNSILQEAIGNINDEYTVGVFSDGTNIYSIAFQRYLGYGSMTKFARLIDDSALTNLSKNIAKVCKLKGPLNIQLRKTPKGYLPFEINPRISSTVYFRHRFGFEDVRWWLDIYNGKKISYLPKYKSGVAVRTIGGVFFDMETF